MNKKKLTMVLVCVILLCGILGCLLCYYQTQQNAKKYDFAGFTTEDAMNFIVEENIQIPEGFEEIEGHEEMALQMIVFAYEHPEYCMGFSNTQMHEFSQEIAEKVHYYMK